jgi:hypothetical protein
VPAGWSVVNAAGGNVFTVGGVTYITWTLTGTATLNPVFATPDACHRLRLLRHRGHQHCYRHGC